MAFGSVSINQQQQPSANVDLCNSTTCNSNRKPMLTRVCQPATNSQCWPNIFYQQLQSANVDKETRGVIQQQPSANADKQTLSNKNRQQMLTRGSYLTTTVGKCWSGEGIQQKPSVNVHNGKFSNNNLRYMLIRESYPTTTVGKCWPSEVILQQPSVNVDKGKLFINNSW